MNTLQTQREEGKEGAQARQRARSTFLPFTLYNGRVTWDKAGKTSAGTTTTPQTVNYLTGLGIDENGKNGDRFIYCAVTARAQKPCPPYYYDPRSLTTMTHDAMPLRTLSRRVDGAFPSVVNPIAIWEIKKYYYTTTFGSRVADGVYETLLDGMELEELEAAAQRKVQHVLFIDDYFTWWVSFPRNFVFQA